MRWTNQVRCCADESCALLHSLEGYTILIAQLSGIYGNVNKPRSRAVALGLGWFTAINPWQPCYNYYITFGTQESQLPLPNTVHASGHSYNCWQCGKQRGKEAYSTTEELQKQTPDKRQALILALETKPLQDGCDTGGRTWNLMHG